MSVNFFYFSVQKRTPACMDVDELQGEIESGNSYVQECERIGQGVNSKESIRLSRCLAEWEERKDREFHVIEYSSGFAVRHRESGEEHWMSDGVDAVFEEDNALSPGSEGFVRKWEDSLNESCDTLEAYFPQYIED